MKPSLLEKLSYRLFCMAHMWKRRSLSGAGINWLKSEKIGPVQFSLGPFSYANGVRVYGWQPELSVTVGKFCSIAEEVTFLAGGHHDHTQVSTSPKFADWAGRQPVNSKGSIVVGNDVWIGHGSIILSGVTIGDGAVVGAGALVTKSIPPYAIVGGHPARIIKYRFPPETIEKLMKSRWWDWDESILRGRANLVADIEKFLEPIDLQSNSKTAETSRE